MHFIIENSRIYYNDESGKLVAEVTFPAESVHVANINHTFVDDSLRGQGIASKLMEAAVQKLRSDGKKVHPTCPYAVSWFQKHPEHADLLA
ncbi:GNAT family N-acetyltransferase [Hydrogenoanaerobacterium sp.]|uniref:GNAT family N-acetyltransferase n=1 Tax=Hydrogenoanaerobacterium sp. TaxID=2953763 RepID=UPI002899B9A6|nr:GNAT family N-acetyltransferase [Hydrogenoanaerobacterium sp.]